MGVVVLVGKQSNNLRGNLTTISGDLQGGAGNLLAGPVAVIEGSVSADQNNYANIYGWLETISGSLNGYSSANTIEGELAGLEDFPGLTATSNRVVIESELPGIEGAFYGGGAIEGELNLIEGALTGTVPVVGRIEHIGPMITGSMFCGAEINLVSVLLTGSMSASVPSIGRISGESKLSVISGSLNAIVPFEANLVGELQTLTGTITAHTDVSSQIAGTLNILTGSMHAQTEIAGSLEGELQLLSGYMMGVHSSIGRIEGALSILTPTSGFQDAAVYDYGILRFVRGETR